MATVFIDVGTQDEPRVEFRSGVDMVVVHLDLHVSVSMRRAQWDALVESAGDPL